MDNTSFNEFLSIFKENESKDPLEWLVHHRNFTPGKQGIVGIFKTKKSYNGKIFSVVFKMSQEIDNLIEHETSVMESMNEVSLFVPNFCKFYGSLEMKRPPKICEKISTNPFLKGDNKYMIKEKVLFLENLDTSSKFLSYIESPKIHEDVLFSSIKQILMAIAIGQKMKNFSHYDLHSLNIMMKKCDNELVLLYILDDKNMFCVPSLGHYPVIIDCGFSYTKDLDDGKFNATFAHTGSGFLCDRFDSYVDPKLFLVTVAEEINHCRASKKAKIFKRVTKNLYRNLQIHWLSGWDDNSDQCSTDQISDIFNDYSEDSRIFFDYEALCIDLFNSLIILPISSSSDKKEDKDQTMRISFKTFMKQWSKIESEISDPYLNLYILKGIIEIASAIRADYYTSTTDEDRNKVIKEFENKLHLKINEVSSFCRPKKINYEKLLVSIYLVSEGMESIYVQELEFVTKMKEKQYKKLPLKSVEEIFGVVESNLATPYKYSKKTQVMIIDSRNQTKNTISLNDLKENDFKNLNTVHSLCIGSVLYDLIK